MDLKIRPTGASSTAKVATWSRAANDSDHKNNYRRARSLNFWGRRGRSLESILITCWKEHTPVYDWKQVIKSGQGYETQVTSTFPWILESQIIINTLLTLLLKKIKMTTKLAMDTGNFSYLCPDLFGIFRNSHRLQCTHCARCDFQNLLKNIRLYDPKNLRNAL